MTDLQKAIEEELERYIEGEYQMDSNELRDALTRISNLSLQSIKDGMGEEKDDCEFCSGTCSSGCSCQGCEKDGHNALHKKITELIERNTL